jgi:transcriptional regulator with XRE-family HTH domain
MGPLRWTVGDFIRKFRQTKGWKQKQLAQRAGVDVSSVIRLEKQSDKSERSTIDRVAKALGVPLSRLHTYVEQATLFSELLEAEQTAVLEYERRLSAKRSGAHEPASSPQHDPGNPASESRVQSQTRRQR